MINHEVQKGKKDYKPGHKFFLKRKIRRFNLRFLITASAWFDPTDAGPLGSDGGDQNKIAGVSFVRLFSPGSWAKNKNSVIVTWRPAEQPGWFEVNAYTNDKKGGFKYGDFFLVEADSFCDVEVLISDHGAASFFFEVPGRHTIMEVDGFDPRGRAIPIGPWFGGNNASPTKHVIGTDFKVYR